MFGFSESERCNVGAGADNTQFSQTEARCEPKMRCWATGVSKRSCSRSKDVRRKNSTPNVWAAETKASSSGEEASYSARGGCSNHRKKYAQHENQVMLSSDFSALPKVHCVSGEVMVTHNAEALMW